MSAATSLFHPDNVVADGKPVAFEDGSATLSGAAGFENEVVPSAQGPDFSRRRRVPRVLRLRLQFGNTVDPVALSKAKGVQITLRDSQSGRRVMCNNCEFASLGEIGGGTVDLVYNVMEPPQWL